MTTDIATVTPLHAETLSKVLLDGNLASLTAAQRVDYMTRVCESLGLNPLTKPFEFLSLNGKLVMYAKRDCTEQLRKIHGVSISIVSRESVEGCYIVTARAQDAKGRHDESIGVVTVEGLKGEARSNALMKAETKAKRRVTLSICGLGMLDESEAASAGGTEYTPPSRIVTESPERIQGAPQDAGKATAASSTLDAPRAPTSAPATRDLDSDWREPNHEREFTPAQMADALRGYNGWKPGRAGTAAAVPPSGGPITPEQIKAIHTILPQLGNVTDEAYRKGVAVYRQTNGQPCVGEDGKGTSKLLSKDQASHLIDRFQAKLEKQSARAAQGVDMGALDVPKAPVPPLEDLLHKAFETDEEQGDWFYSMWGVRHFNELENKEPATALQLLIAMSQGDAVYDAAVTKAREGNLIR